MAKRCLHIDRPRTVSFQRLPVICCVMLLSSHCLQPWLCLCIHALSTCGHETLWTSRQDVSHACLPLLQTNRQGQPEGGDAHTDHRARRLDRAVSTRNQAAKSTIGLLTMLFLRSLLMKWLSLVVLLLGTLSTADCFFACQSRLSSISTRHLARDVRWYFDVDGIFQWDVHENCDANDQTCSLWNE